MDIARLENQVADAAARLDQQSKITRALAEMEKPLGAISEALQSGIVAEAARAIAHLDDHRSGKGAFMQAFEEQARIFDSFKFPTLDLALENGVGGFTGAASEALRAAAQLHTLTEDWTRSFATDPVFESLRDGILSQQSLIDQLQLDAPNSSFANPPIEAPNYSSIATPPVNPSYETNERLERIERQLRKLQRLGTNTASNANLLQAHATNLLQKFESAANTNERTAARSLRVGTLAVIATVVVTLAVTTAQFVYTEFWRAPRDASLSAALVSQLISSMEAEQAPVTMTDDSGHLLDQFSVRRDLGLLTFLELPQTGAIAK